MTDTVMKERVFTVKIPSCPEGITAKQIMYMFQDELGVFPTVTEK